MMCWTLFSSFSNELLCMPLRSIVYDEMTWARELDSGAAIEVQDDHLNKRDKPGRLSTLRAETTGGMSVSLRHPHQTLIDVRRIPSVRTSH